MTLHHKTFCFVCTHLASGEKEGDEIKRNSDVMEILKKTKFSHSRIIGKPLPPDNILDHEYVFSFLFVHFFPNKTGTILI